MIKTKILTMQRRKYYTSVPESKYTRNTFGIPRWNKIHLCRDLISRPSLVETLSRRHVSPSYSRLSDFVTDYAGLFDEHAHE